MSLFWAVGGQIKSVKNTNRSYFYFLISLELRHKENKISVVRILVTNCLIVNKTSTEARLAPVVQFVFVPCI